MQPVKSLEQLRKEIAERMKGQIPHGEVPSPVGGSPSDEVGDEAESDEGETQDEKVEQEAQEAKQEEKRKTDDAEQKEEKKKQPEKKPAPRESINREQWLESASAILRSEFESHKRLSIPDFRVSVGFPHGKRGTNKIQGQTIQGRDTKDGVPQVFVTPIAETSGQALTVLTAEMASVYDETKVGATRLHLGLLASGNAGPDLESTFRMIEKDLGPYPHSGVKVNEGTKKASMPRYACAVDGIYKVWVARGNVERFGAPICPCHKKEMK